MAAERGKQMARISFVAVTFVTSLLIFARTLAPAATPTPKPPFTFKGKTVTILVAYSVGGAADILARQVQPFLQKHLPGNPTVIVQNMPGGDGMLGGNWLYQVAPKDGTFIGQLSTLFSNGIFLPERAKYDLAKVRWLGGQADTSVLFGRKELGINSAEEFAKLKEKLFVALTQITDQRSAPIVIFLRLMGVDRKIITGYGSSGDMRAAIVRGEINATADSLPGYFAAVRPLVAQGIVVPLGQAGIVKGGQIVRDPRLSDVTTYAEVLVKLKGPEITKTLDYRAMELASSINGLIRGWIYPPGVPEEVFEVTTAAFDKLLHDPEMLKVFEKSVGYMPIHLNAAEAQEVANKIVEDSKRGPEVTEFLRKLQE